MAEIQIFNRICMATDGSEESLKAANLAIEVAKINSASLYLIYVIDDKVIEKILGMSKKTAEEVKDEYSSSGRASLQFIKKLAEKKGIHTETQLDEGYPSEKIIEYTKKINADLLVIGHHYRKSSRFLALGGRTVKIIELSNCPILIVK